MTYTFHQKATGSYCRSQNLGLLRDDSVSISWRLPTVQRNVTSSTDNDSLLGRFRHRVIFHRKRILNYTALKTSNFANCVTLQSTKWHGMINSTNSPASGETTMTSQVDRVREFVCAWISVFFFFFCGNQSGGDANICLRQRDHSR